MSTDPAQAPRATQYPPATGPAAPVPRRHLPPLLKLALELGPLGIFFFANARFFVEDVLERIDRAEHAGRDVRVVVVTAEPITDVDTTAADAIDELIRDLAARDVTLRFTELKGHVRERMQAYGLIDRIGAQHLSRTTGEAVHSASESTAESDRLSLLVARTVRR